MVKKVTQKEIKKPVKEKKKEKVLTKEELALLEIAKKRDQLINEIKPNLLSKSQLKRGGSNIRSKHGKEQGYIPVLEEINALGKKLKLKPIGLGHLRGE